MPNTTHHASRITFHVSRFTFHACVLLALLSVLTGCWPFSGSSTDGQPTGGLPPAEEGALNIAGGTQDPPTLDPALANDAYSMFIIQQLFSGLVTFNNDLQIVPDLAATLPSVSADGKTYTFVLRKGVRFSDGQEVTSSDFKYSMERAADPKLAGSQPAASLPAALYLSDIVGVREKLDGTAAAISGVVALDPYTLVLTIDAPKSYFLAKLTAGPAFVVQQANVESGPRWLENPHGTGPFKLDKWVHDDQMVLTANAEYYGGPPQLPKINVWMGANATGGLQQYEVGGLDVTSVPIDDIERVSDKSSPMAAELQTVPDLSVTYLAFDQRQKPFEDPKIREALSLVIDKQKLVRVMFQSRVSLAEGFVPPGMGGYKGPEAGETYNVSRARQLIAESTYKTVESLPRMRLYTTGSAIGPMLKDVLSDTLGIDLEVYDVEWSDFLQGLDNREYPMFTMGWGADYPDPENFLGSLFRSTSPSNHTGYNNPQVDDQLNQAAVEPDLQTRMFIYANVEGLILKDYPAVPLYHSVQYQLVKPYVKNYKVTPMGVLSLKDVRLERP